MKKKHLIERLEYLDGEIMKLENELFDKDKEIYILKHNILKPNDIVMVCDNNLDDWDGVLCFVDRVDAYRQCIRVRMREPHRDGIYYANFKPDQLRKVGEL